MSIYVLGPRTMARDGEPVIALIYDDDAYVESAGLLGRRVAGRTFLEAYLAHGRFNELATLIRKRSSTATMIETWRNRPADGGPERSLRIVEQCSFHKTFLRDPPATVIHAPQPPDWKLAWARQQAGTHAFSLTGVTHTLCSIECVTMLRELVTSPYEPYDAMICTSRAVVEMVRRVTDSYAEYLRSRFGGTAAPERSTIRLETIPLGVDTDRFRPARPDERRGPQGTGHRRGRGARALRRPAGASRQGPSLPDVPRRQRGRPARGAEGPPGARRLAAQPGRQRQLPRGGEAIRPRGADDVRRRPRRQGPATGLAGGRPVRLAVGQHPGDVRAGRHRGDGQRPAGRCHRLGRLPRPGQRRRDRAARPGHDDGGGHRRRHVTLPHRRAVLRLLRLRVQPGDGRRPAGDGRGGLAAGRGRVVAAEDGGGGSAAGPGALRLAEGHRRVRGALGRARRGAAPVRRAGRRPRAAAVERPRRAGDVPGARAHLRRLSHPHDRRPRPARPRPPAGRGPRGRAVDGADQSCPRPPPRRLPAAPRRDRDGPLHGRGPRPLPRRVRRRSRRRPGHDRLDAQV